MARPVHKGLVMLKKIKLLGLMVLMIVLNGCASKTVPGGADQWNYNAYTGYPAVGWAGSSHL